MPCTVHGQWHPSNSRGERRHRHWSRRYVDAPRQEVPIVLGVGTLMRQTSTRRQEADFLAKLGKRLATFRETVRYVPAVSERPEYRNAARALFLVSIGYLP